MKYIPDVDEQLPPPPYHLGTKDSRFESHHVLIKSDRKELQLLVNRQLNLALWRALSPPMTPAQLQLALAEHDAANVPYGRASKVTATGAEPKKLIRYVVPPEMGFVRLTFARYWRVESASLNQEGSSAYTECLISFVVRREAEGEINELMRFLGVVYIDDRAFQGEVQDPQALPIMLGREMYGLPKGPGQIFYCPDVNDIRDPRFPLLRIWVQNAMGPANDALVLKNAIVVDGGPPPGTPNSCPAPPTESNRPGRSGRILEQFEPLATELGIPREEIRDRFSPASGAERGAWIVRLGRDFSGPQSEAIVWEDLHLYTRLVGLKQVPDPTKFDSTTKAMGTSYCAVVESPLEVAKKMSERPIWLEILDLPEVLFDVEPVQRVDMLQEFAIEEAPPGSRIANVVEGHYGWGDMIFGNPDRTIVWEP